MSDPRSGNAQKTKQMSRAGDGGTAHAKGGGEGMPLNAMLRPSLLSARAFSIMGACGPIAVCTSQNGAHAH